MEEKVIRYLEKSRFFLPEIVIKVAVEAIRKTIAKKMVNAGTYWDKGDEYIVKACSECGKEFAKFDEITRYCPDCGQKLGRY